MEELVSIIIPTYNRADTICTTVNSVIRQDYRPLEILIVDDGSTDNTYAMIKRLLCHTNELVVKYIFQKNGGVSSARNRGINIASGQFISFLDSDDILLPRKISSQVKMMKKENADICYGNYYRTKDENDFPIIAEPPKKDVLLQYLGMKIMMQLDSWMFSKGLINTNHLNFTIGKKWGEDCEFIIKALSISNKTIYVNQFMSKYIIGRMDGLSKFSWEKLDEDIANYTDIIKWLETRNGTPKQIKMIKRWLLPNLIIMRILEGMNEKVNAKKYFKKYHHYMNCFCLVNNSKNLKLMIRYMELRILLFT